MKKPMKVFSKVHFRDSRPYVRGTNIPVELLIGLGAAEIKKNYPWLEDDQIEDALNFVKALVNNRKNASSINQIPSA